MAIGKQNKDGIIIKSSKGFNYYHGRNEEHGMRKVQTDPVGLRNRRLAIKTMKVYDVVEIANNKISVKIYPDGNIIIEPSV